MNILYILVTAVLWILSLQLYQYISLRFFTHGTLRIDRTNPLKDVYRLDVEDIDKLSEKKRIVLKVDPNADLS